MYVFFTDKEMIDFGKYLLSDERTALIKEKHKGDGRKAIESKLKDVYHADFQNYLALQKETPTE